MTFLGTLKVWGVDEALRRYPQLSIIPFVGDAVVLAGRLTFTARAPGYDTISDAYDIEISVPPSFPRDPPTARDIGGRIARDYHRLDDGSFCLGSPARLRLMLAQTPTVVAFIERCVIPYLYGYSFFARHGRPPFGELAHGDPGLIQDHMQMFGVTSLRACIGMLNCLGHKRRIANKLPCPCESGRRVARCHHVLLNRLRPLLGRAWCRAQASWLIQEYGDNPVAADGPGKLRLASRQAEHKSKGSREKDNRPMIPTSSAAA